MMNKCLVRLFTSIANILLILSLAPSFRVQAAIYYVAPTGNDINAGTSASLPKKTIQSAANSAACGDTINVMTGTYSEQVWLRNRTCTSTAPMVISNYNGQTVTLDGSVNFAGTSQWVAESGNIYKSVSPVGWVAKMVYQGETKLWNFHGTAAVTTSASLSPGEWYRDASGYLHVYALGGGNPGNYPIKVTRYPEVYDGNYNGLVDVSGSSYIKLIGLQLSYSNVSLINGYAETGIELQNLRLAHAYSSFVNLNTCTNCVINNLKATDGGFAYRRDAAYTEAHEGLRFWKGSGVRITNCEISDFYNMGIDLFGGHSGGLVENCYIHDAANPNYQYDSGIYIDGGADNIIRNNRVYNTHIGYTIGTERTGESAHHNKVYNNICYNSLTGCLFLRSMGGSSLTTNNLIAYNTLVQSNSNAAITIGDGLSGNSIENNIVVNYSTGGLLNNSGGSNTIDYNCYYGGSLAGLHSISADPKFTNRLTLDFNLQPDSPCSDKALPSLMMQNNESVVIDHDLAGKTRPQGTGYDMGAYEYAASNPPPSATPLPPHTPIPGDANLDTIIDDVDYQQWLTGYLEHLTGWTNGDFDANDLVNGVDYVIWLNHLSL